MYPQTMLENTKNEIELEDEKYRNSKQRIDDGWKIHSYIFKNIFLIIGMLTVKLTRYYKKIDGKTITFIWRNNFLSSNKWQRVSQDIKNISSSLHNSGSSSNDVSKHLKLVFGLFINPKTAWNYAKKMVITPLKNDYKELAKNKKYIYIEADDSYNNVRKENKKVNKNRFRMVNVHLGKNDKKQIIGKTLVLETRQLNDKNKFTSKQWATYLQALIRQIYGNNFEIIVVGDGAKWIKNTAIELKSKYILDIFHIKKKATEILGYTPKKNKKNKLIFSKFESTSGFNFWEKFNYLVDIFNFNEAILLLENIYNSYPEMDKIARKKVKQLRNYLTNNIISQDYYDPKKGYIGCHTEPFISHYIAKPIRKNKATFGLKSIQKMMKSITNENLQYLFI